MNSAKLIASDFLKWLGRNEDDMGVRIFVLGFMAVIVLFISYELSIVARYIGLLPTLAIMAFVVWITAGYISWKRYIAHKSRIILGNPRDKQE